MNNSNNENNGELNSISLGSVSNNANNTSNPPVEPVAPVSLGSVPVTPVMPAGEDNKENPTPVVQNKEVVANPIPVQSNEGQSLNNAENNTPPVTLPENTENKPEEEVKEPEGPVMPKEPLPGIESPIPTSIPQEESPIAPPVAPVNPIPDVNVGAVPPVAPVSYDVPDTINNFDATPIFDEIGTVPPIPDAPVNNSVPPTPDVKPAKAKKKGINKTLFVVIIILALAAVAAAVYFLLNKANEPKFSVKLKEVTVEVGGVLSTDINDYGIFYGINQSQCSLDTTSVQNTKEANKEYEFLVRCGDNTYKGKLKVVDTKTPEVTLKEAKVAINGTVNPEDFIASCKDDSGCTYEFKDANSVLEYVKAKDNYHVPIIVKDGAGNEIEVNGTLIVDEVVSDLYLSCTKVSNDYEELSKFGISNSSFNRITDRVYTFKFATLDEYNNFKTVNEGQTVVTYKGIAGTPNYDDANLKLMIERRVSYDDLVKELEGEVPASLGEMRTFFSNKGYSCVIN